MKALGKLVIVGIACIGPAVLAQTIDFETLPDGTPTADDMTITNEYNVPPYWVCFAIEGGQPSDVPRIAKVGPPATAFAGPDEYSDCIGGYSFDDMPAPGEPVQCSFLVGPGSIQDPLPLLVSYTYPVQSACGVILDVDGAEEWTITALGSDTLTVIDAQFIQTGMPETGTGIATPWRVSFPDGISFVRFVGHKPEGFFGWALDNFAPSGFSEVPQLSPFPAVLCAHAPNPSSGSVHISSRGTSVARRLLL